MNGFSNKDLMYGILGATLADKKSSADAKLSRNEMFKISLLNAIGGSQNSPALSMIKAKLDADARIEANTAIARNKELEAELQKLTAASKKQLTAAAATPVPGKVSTGKKAASATLKKP